MTSIEAGEILKEKDQGNRVFHELSYFIVHKISNFYTRLKLFNPKLLSQCKCFPFFQMQFMGHQRTCVLTVVD